MAPGSPGDDDLHEAIARIRRDRARRAHGFRERAFALFPPVCARCGRDFEGKALHDLTVHHRDHNHEHNPPDGSNWELLCTYCHENEHARNAVASAYDAPSDAGASPASTYQPFAGLDTLLKKPR